MYYIWNYTYLNLWDDELSLLTSLVIGVITNAFLAMSGHLYMYGDPGKLQRIPKGTLYLIKWCRLFSFHAECLGISRISPYFLVLLR